MKAVGAASFGKSAIDEAGAEGEGGNGKSTKTRILHSVGSAVTGKMKRSGSGDSGQGVPSAEGEKGKKKNLDILKRVKSSKRSS